MEEIRTLSTCSGCGERPLRDQYHFCPGSAEAHHVAAALAASVSQMFGAGLISRDTVKALTDPLEKAIRNPQVDISVVIELAERRA